jgi:uncharacterized protein YjbI with pentapeptide repeats
MEILMSNSDERSSLPRLILRTLLHRKTNKVQQPLHQQSLAPSPPQADDHTGRREYWRKIGQPWRTEPEIDASRQQFLAERRSIVPNIEKGIYPFKDVKLCRADVEWLLATHENGRGPVDWHDGSQRKREGLDVRGADLRQEDLHYLPLTHLLGGLARDEWIFATKDQRDMAAVHLEDTKLNGVYLEGAILNSAYLERAYLRWSHLEEAALRRARLQKADLYGTHLEGAGLRQAELAGVGLQRAHLEGAELDNACLSDEKCIGPRLAEAHWEGTNLAVIQWSKMKLLGDENKARQRTRNGKVKDQATRLNEFEEAVRANRQLAVALQAQGLNEVAARFAYRSNVLQKSVFRLQMLQHDVNFIQRVRIFLSYLFSWFLFLIAGYGYRPGRTLLWYLLVICGFAFTYSRVGSLPLLPDALVFSIMSFHGRGFFPSLNDSSTLSLHSPLIVLAAAEAVVGLLIEISFIATFTQRFFGK